MNLFELLRGAATGTITTSVTEASDSPKLTNSQNTAGEYTNLTVDLVTDEFMNRNIKYMKMGEVTNPSPYSGSSIVSPDGVFSPYIFGTTPNDRKRRFGYIDLHCHVLHPFVYEVLLKINRKIEKVVAGYGAWIINDKGELEEVLDGDPKYNPLNTGLDWLYKNYDKFIFHENKSRIRSERLTLIKGLSRDEAFISKWLVIPIFYRDIQMVNGIPTTPMINKYYNSIVQYSQQLGRDNFEQQMNRTKMLIQNTLVEIRKHGQSLTEKKNGFFKKNVIGKSIDNGYRSVISVPNIQDYDKPSENPINLYYSGIPLSQACILGYPFMGNFITEFFRQMFDTYNGRLPVYKNLTDETPQGYIQLDDPMNKFTNDYIQRKIELYHGTPGTRYRRITVRGEDGKDYPIKFTGKLFGKDATNPKINAPRYLTWTDVLYICAMRALSKKHVYITRYPLNDYFGTFPSRIHIMSTTKTCKMKFSEGGVVETFDFYPIVIDGMSEQEVSTQFNDTLCMDNAYLKGINGDYDGDMCTIKMVYSEEANEEAERLMKSERHYVNIAGGAMRNIGLEAILCAYNMTRDQSSYDSKQ